MKHLSSQLPGQAGLHDPPRRRQLSLQGHRKKILHSFLKRIEMKTPPPLAGRLQGSGAGMKDAALPQGDSAPNCVTPASRPEDATQFWCLLCGSQRCRHAGKAKFRSQTGAVLHTRPEVTRLRDSQRIDAVRSLHALQHHCRALAA